MQINLQFFGGRGASAGTKNNIVAFRGKSSGNSNLWDYKGEKERVDNLEKAVYTTKGLKAQQNLALALKKQDEHITLLINQENRGSNDVKGDVNELVTLRRRVRQAQKILKSKR